MEREKPEVTRINKDIEQYKQHQVEDMAVLSENMEAVQSHKAEKRELKAQVVRVPFFVITKQNLSDLVLYPVGGAHERDTRHHAVELCRQRPDHAVP